MSQARVFSYAVQVVKKCTYTAGDYTNRYRKDSPFNKMKKWDV